jgi:hypothetical protein
MMRKFLLAAAIAALSTSAAQAQPANAGRVVRERGGIAAQEAKVIFTFAFGQPYYQRHYYDQPYAPYQDPYQYCRLGV